MTAKRRLKNAKITLISLCKKGRNKLKTVMKSDGGIELQTISKMSKEGLLYNLVWVPEMEDIDGDIMNLEEVQKMCHGWLANGGKVDVEHNQIPLSNEQLQICENLIVQKGDSRFANMTYEGETIDPTGAWGTVFKILDPVLKAAYDSGEWDGVSMFGQAEAEPIKKHQTPRTKKVMDEEDIKKMAEAVAKSTVAALKADREAVTKAEAEAKLKADLKKAQDGSPDAIKFEGDPSVEADIVKHQQKVAFADLDFSDAKAVEAYRKTIAKSEGDDDDSEGESEEVTAIKAEQVKLQKQLDAIEKSSNVDVIDSDKDKDDKPSAEAFGLSKSELEGAELGAALMAAVNGTPDAKK